MCGIIVAKNLNDNKKSVNEDVINQLEDQINRGKNGFGIVMVDNKMNYKIYRATEMTKTLLDLYNNQSQTIMLHHRMPTSSENKLSQTHPFLIENEQLKNKYLIIHNGVINNTDKLKKNHENLGFTYKSIRNNKANFEEFNDSESLAIEIAMYIEGISSDIKAQGSIAFAAIEIDNKTNKATTLHFGRNDENPLNMAMNNKKFRLSSEGEGDTVSKETLYHLNLKTNKLTKNKLIFYEEKKEFKHVMPIEQTHYSKKEIDIEKIPFQTNNQTKLLKNKEQIHENIYSTQLYANLLEITEETSESITAIVSDFTENLEEIETLTQMEEILDDTMVEIAKKILIELRESYQKCKNLYYNELIELAEEEKNV